MKTLTSLFSLLPFFWGVGWVGGCRTTIGHSQLGGKGHVEDASTVLRTELSALKKHAVYGWRIR